MGEVKKKVLRAVIFNIMRDLVAFVNQNEITKEDLVSVLQDKKDNYVLLYYSE